MIVRVSSAFTNRFRNRLSGNKTSSFVSSKIILDVACTFQNYGGSGNQQLTIVQFRLSTLVPFGIRNLMTNKLNTTSTTQLGMQLGQSMRRKSDILFISCSGKFWLRNSRRMLFMHGLSSLDTNLAWNVAGELHIPKNTRYGFVEIGNIFLSASRSHNCSDTQTLAFDPSEANSKFCKLKKYAPQSTASVTTPSMLSPRLSRLKSTSGG
jgi:hypothetical protein